MSQDHAPKKKLEPVTAETTHVQPLPDEVLDEVAGGVLCSMATCSNVPN